MIRVETREVQSSTGKTDWTDWQEQEQNKKTFGLCGVQDGY